jgi:hypothetical protein
MIRGLFIMAPSLLLNPTLDAERIEAEIAEDPEAGRSEWLGLFRADLAQFLDDELIDRAVSPGRRELPYVPREHYFGFIDSSAGRHDAMTLAIAHPEVARIARAEGTRLVLDRVLIESPPFEPEAVVQKFCEQARAFGLTSVTGDRFAGEWVTAAFRKYGIGYEPSALDKSAIYCEALPLFAQNRVELLDIPRLLTELRLLERRPRSGGKGDIVDHPPRAYDDAANAACGALWLASQKSVRALVHGRSRPRQAITEYDEFNWRAGA